MKNLANPPNGQNWEENISLEIRKFPDDSEWDKFAASLLGSSHVQASLWGQVKNEIGWNPLRLVYKRGPEILAGVQILTRNFPLGVAVHYVPRGPLYQPGYQDLACSLVQDIKKHIRFKWLHFLAIQPNVDDEWLIPCLQKSGFKRSELELAPSTTLIIDLQLSEDQLLEKMKRQTRQNIRRSVIEGITSRVGSEADLTTFYQLHVHTSQRQNFLPYKEAYFRKMWEVFSVTGKIYLVFAEKNGEAISALLSISFGDTMYSKILGWSGSHSEARPNEAVFWASIMLAKSQGLRFFDMEGVSREGAVAVLNGQGLPEHLKRSPDFLKYGFGGKVVVMPETYEYASNPIYLWGFRKMEFKIGGQGIASIILDRIRKR